ncbi:TPA: hypothetical protein ACH3X1_009234 [Trebouxia sp. C0004]
MLHLQLREAKLLWPRSPHVRLLERRYQTHLRHSRSKFAQREIVDFSQLLRTNPRKFWQAARLPNMMLPRQLHDQAAWDSFLPTQHATQLPAPHTPQPPAPAHSLNQPLTLAEVEVGGATFARGKIRGLARLHFRAVTLCSACGHTR